MREMRLGEHDVNANVSWSFHCRSDRREIHIHDVHEHSTRSVSCADFEHAWQSEAVQK